MYVFYFIYLIEFFLFFILSYLLPTCVSLFVYIVFFGT